MMRRDARACCSLVDSTSSPGRCTSCARAVYESIVPDALPAKRELVYASGVAEIVGGAGVLHPRTRRAAGWWLIATLVAIFPANVNMAVHARALPGGPARRCCGSACPSRPC